MTPTRAVGNRCADVLAGLGAELCAVLPPDKGNYLHVVEKARLVQKRLVRLLQHFSDSFPRERADRPSRRLVPRLSWLGAGLSSAHALVPHLDEWQCARCLTSAPCGADTAEFVDWLFGPCEVNHTIQAATLEGGLRPTSIPAGVKITVGGTKVDPSHVLLLFKGLYVCTVCGHYAGARARCLAHPCKGFALSSGQRVVKDVRAGLRPWGMELWPSESRLADSMMIRLG